MAEISTPSAVNCLLVRYDGVAKDEKVLPDGDFSGHVETGNATTRRGFLFSNDLSKTESIT